MSKLMAAKKVGDVDTTFESTFEQSSVRDVSLWWERKMTKEDVLENTEDLRYLQKICNQAL